MARHTTNLLFFCIALLGSMASMHAFAQDFGSVIKGVLQNRPGDVASVIKSIVDVSSGQIGSLAGPQDADGKVVLYTTAWCSNCKRAISYMQQKNIPFVERNIETSSDFRAEYSRLGGKGIPFFVFGSQTMADFTEGAFNERYAAFQRTLPASNTPSTAIGMQTTSPLGSASIQPGDTLVCKIAGIKVYARASKAAQRLAVLGKTDEVVYMGEEKEGLYLVMTPLGEGWVDKLLVKKL
jgi:glutaredoxin